ncbi:hypothetical protein HD554DRAFT_2121118 [Boletus coccyginus]|nr:hypothetical protein HD554DRAFT_2121118 [Boletus coccyginus]
MSLPSTEELKDVIVDILTRAQDEGRLSQLTVRIVRQELAAHFDIEEDVLNGEKYKSFIRDTVLATVNRLRSASEDCVEPPRSKATKWEKSDGKAKTGKRKRQSKVQVHSSGEEADASESEAPPLKKPSACPRPSKPIKPGNSSRKPESEMKYKSKAIIESSDEEGAPESGTRKSARSPKKEKMTPKSSPPKQKVNKDDSDIEMDTGEGPGPSSSISKPKRTTESPKHSVSKAKESTGDPMESELSSVIDELPKTRQKKQGRKDEKTKRGKKKEALSKDEETVNRLKGIVVACGVRKVWKKEFDGLDKPSQQIKRLHSILGDLGMTPRYTLEKAKTIRERRELAQELKDVQEFDKAIKRRGKVPRSPSELGEPTDQDESDAERINKNARASIMAFLHDQSEEE